jgi:hypothetical protein
MIRSGVAKMRMLNFALQQEALTLVTMAGPFFSLFGDKHCNDSLLMHTFHYIMCCYLETFRVNRVTIGLETTAVVNVTRLV